MPDVVEVLAKSITRQIDGKDYELKRLNSYDQAELLRELRAELREKVKNRCKETGLDASQTYIELKEFDDDPPSNWVKYVSETPEGKNHAVRLSLRKKGYDADALIKQQDWDTAEMTEIIMFICNLVWKPIEPEADPNATYGNEGHDPNAQPPTT